MSIEYMNWAMTQRLDGPSAQCVLYVIADCADQNGKTIIGTAYIAERTRQSRKTVQRRMQELEEAGLLVRLIRKDKNNRRTTDELRLQKARTVVVASPAEKNSPEDHDAAQDVEEGETPENKSGVSNCPGVLDTGVHSVWTRESRGYGHSCPDMNPLLDPRENPEETPQSPPEQTTADAKGREGGKEISSNHGISSQGAGANQAGFTFQDFTRKYPIPILHLSDCLNIWSVYDDEERRGAVIGAGVYADFIKTYDRRPIDAVRFLRERTWEGLIQKDAAVSAERTVVSSSAESYRAWLNVCISAYASHGDPPEPPYYWRCGPNAISVRGEWPVGGRGWLVPLSEWVFVEQGTRQFFAYVERTHEMFDRAPALRRGTARDGHRLISTDGAAWGAREFRGLLVPSEWPPARGEGGKEAKAPSIDPGNAATDVLAEFAESTRWET